jgi:hypothetical protein
LIGPGSFKNMDTRLACCSASAQVENAPRCTVSGKFGVQRSQGRKEPEEKMKKGPEYETVWVTRWYNPNDLRMQTPVSRHKLVALDPLPVPADPQWVPASDPPLASFQRPRLSREFYSGHASTRDERWSTLRQMLPSLGTPQRTAPPNWGTGLGPPPRMANEAPLKLPIIKSAMTR